mgnify:FL=1
MKSFLPLIMEDCNEPFALSAIGVTRFVESGPSPSFRRIISLKAGEEVIEYALFWRYDIQHLYDLEHIWVTLTEGVPTNIEASFHGKYLNASRLATRTDDGRFIIYCQPGKHAFLPDPSLFALLPDSEYCCNRDAGEAGLLVTGPFEGLLHTDEQINERVKAHIKERWAFSPSWQWRVMKTSTVPQMGWDALKVHVVQTIEAELSLIP